MRRKELCQAISKETNLSAIESARFVDVVFETMAQTLEKGEEVKISGFGTFSVREKKARMGRNPRTGESLPISARKVVTFQPSHFLRKPIAEESHDGRGIDKPFQEDPEH